MFFNDFYWITRVFSSFLGCILGIFKKSLEMLDFVSIRAVVFCAFRASAFRGAIFYLECRSHVNLYGNER